MLNLNSGLNCVESFQTPLPTHLPRDQYIGTSVTVNKRDWDSQNQWINRDFFLLPLASKAFANGSAAAEQTPHLTSRDVHSVEM